MLEVLLESARWGHTVDIVVRPAQRLPHEDSDGQVPVVQNAVRGKSDEFRLLVPLVVDHGSVVFLLQYKDEENNKRGGGEFVGRSRMWF